MLRVAVKGEKAPHILRIHSEEPPKEIYLDDQNLSSSSWSYDEKLKKILIKTGLDYRKGDYSIKF